MMYRTVDLGSNQYLVGDKGVWEASDSYMYLMAAVVPLSQTLFRLHLRRTNNRSREQTASVKVKGPA